MTDTTPKARSANRQEIKAFTHPLRMRMYRLLQNHGQATASMLARETGESTGQTSYHLRQLERFGFVEEVPGAGSGRERWWTALGFSYEATNELGGEFDDETVKILQRWSLDNLIEDLGAAAERLGTEAEPWLRAGTGTVHTQWMTAAELEALVSNLLQVIEEHSEKAKQRHDESAVPGRAHTAVHPDERRIRIYLHALPLPPSETDVIG